MTGCASSTYCWPPAPASAKCSHSPGTTSTASTVTVPSPCTSVTDSTRNPTGHKAGGEPYTVTTPEFGAATLREHARRGTHQPEANVRTRWRAIRGEDFK
ncbi:hypothetical protein I551_6775 [Mycobacterium ulcerans str. Harvey]|uniref:Uncharacterized protein n=1 Tax=Mycobacterium ulcerans str. Harvey TaxID=1299332 RepID=A0ABN0QPL2_MYCUL|nr:hypothetical protein I551_6775 [Mycobacterium ulcerans str. Harvey]